MPLSRARGNFYCFEAISLLRCTKHKCPTKFLHRTICPFSVQNAGTSFIFYPEPCFLPADGYIGQTGNPLKGGIARSSKDSTLSKNEDRLRGLGSQAKCGSDVCNHGFRIYKMAYESGMTRKRPIELILSSCLYIASRRFKTGHMMADFVPLLNGDIYDLAKTVRFFITRLCISVPLLDPIMQVERFCHELINDKTLVPKLVNLAYRIVERMKKDWIDAGRKPGAVAAAAVIIACRVNNHEVDLEDVAKVAQVSVSSVVSFVRTWLKSPKKTK